SDIKLLELANLNHPLLRELIVRAPGTYHHSHLVGILGEAAAESIGANPLLVRVGAYYHDIGKLKKPQYFIENSKSGENKHEKISPNMSALVISAHVKDGMELALSSGIPKRIADMIPQHHGTRLMSYFYAKAKEGENPDVEKVDEKDFRYPGPKPQTREAAILMLADTVEASVRALKEKGSARIQQTVERSINDIFAESQLDDCELTLQDLHDIAKAFVRILLGIYHQRIEYPKNEEDKNEISIIDENSTRETDSLESSPEEESQSQGS
ncbi:MAG TPA: HDIG domain-containing protein, partial [bacterium]|nr:HDIG domain-containing protein [bacterium]